MPNSPLPDPFLFPNRTRVKTKADWKRRRAQFLKQLVDIHFGGMPPTPAKTRVTELHTANHGWLNAHQITYRIQSGPKLALSFILTLFIPYIDGEPSKKPLPVLINGDACWHYATDDVLKTILSHGYIFAQFNRVEIASDLSGTRERAGQIYNLFPKARFGAISAWAWGYQRCVDALLQMNFVDPKKIAIVGHSRGGKATLLAGATDERIAAVSANNSGAGGAGCYRWQGEGSETIADHLANFPYWFGPKLPSYIGRVDKLPFDQHFLKAAIAPRILLTTEALDDIWANPSGAWRTHEAAAEVFKFLNAKDNLAIWYRPGEHFHRLQDWQILLDTLDWKWHNAKPPKSLNLNPFPNLEKAYSWSAP